MLKGQLAFIWTGLFKIPTLSPCSPAVSPGGRPVRDKVIFLDLPPNVPGPDTTRRVSVARCPLSAVLQSARHRRTRLGYLSAGLTGYVTNKSTTKSTPYPVTSDDISPCLERLDVDCITGYNTFVRGRGGVLAIMY